MLYYKQIDQHGNIEIQQLFLYLYVLGWEAVHGQHHYTKFKLFVWIWILNLSKDLNIFIHILFGYYHSSSG